HIRPVRCLEIGQPQHYLPVRLLIHRRATRSGVELAVELARLQRLCFAVVHDFVVLHLVVLHVVLCMHPWLEQKRPGQRRECQTCLDRPNHSNLSSTLSFGGRFLCPLIPFASYEPAARQRLQPAFAKRTALSLLPPVTFRGKPTRGPPQDSRQTGIITMHRELSCL